MQRRRISCFISIKGVKTWGNDEWWTLKLDSYDVRVDLMGEKDAIEDLFRTKKVDYRMIDNDQIAI